MPWTAEFEGIVAASLDANCDDEHDPEGATIAFERERTAALRGQVEAHLGDVDRALARVAAGDVRLLPLMSTPYRNGTPESTPSHRAMHRLRQPFADRPFRSRAVDRGSFSRTPIGPSVSSATATAASTVAQR